MDAATSGDDDRLRIVPGLHAIQEKYGYLEQAALRDFSARATIPLQQLQAVASFFPHFQLKPPPLVSVRVCRDMACHMNGAAGIIRELQTLAAPGEVDVGGVSCLGRCDRAPAACVTVSTNRGGPAGALDPENEPLTAEAFFVARDTRTLAAVVKSCHKNPEKAVTVFHAAHEAAMENAGRHVMLPPGKHNPGLPDFDGDCPDTSGDWLIDPYKGKEPNYLGVLHAVAARDAALQAAGSKLKNDRAWNNEQLEQFWTGVMPQETLGRRIDRSVADEMRNWLITDNWADVILTEMDDAHADLRGMGGAGVPATQKWRDVRAAVRDARRRRADDRAYIVVNGDESEPGTFKDRELLLRTPHLIVEAVILAGLITEACEGFIYIRHEYPEQIAACRRAIEKAEELGVCGKTATALGRPFPVSVFTSPGGYICGEQSALLEAMSDRRGEPRNLPPKLETNGLDDRPTLVSNVETYAWVPLIWLNGGANYAALGTNECKGRRFFSVSGDVVRPGVYEVPMGMTLRELVYGEKYCQGMAGGKKLKAFAPSGPSGGFLPAKLTVKAGLPRKHLENKAFIALSKRRDIDPAAVELDLMDLELELNLFRALSPTQALGAGLVVYNEDRDMTEQAVNSLQFFRNESCGKCVPCREGSQRMAQLGGNLLAGKIGRQRWTEELQPLSQELGEVMGLTSICGLGRSVPVPLKTVSDFFPDDLTRHLTERNGEPIP